MLIDTRLREAKRSTQCHALGRQPGKRVVERFGKFGLIENSLINQKIADRCLYQDGPLIATSNQNIWPGE